MVCSEQMVCGSWATENGLSYSSFRRSNSHKMQAAGQENLVDMLKNSARYSTMSKEKNISSVLANGVIFSLLKHTDPNSRSTLKVGKLVSVHFETGCSMNSIAKEPNDLAKALPESNQKSRFPRKGLVTGASIGARVIKCKPFFFLGIWLPKGGSWSQAFLVETVETGHKNLV